VPAFSYSLKKALEKPRKYYAYDLGLMSAVSKSFSPDTGRKAENAVAIELVRQGREIQYYSNGYEVDFVIKDGLNLTTVNVCTSAAAPARETIALQRFSEEHKTSKALLLKGMKETSDWLTV
jgi:hypothetical protein